MLHINLINFISYYFVSAQLNSIVVFHCFPNEDLHTLAALMRGDTNLFMQHVNMGNSKNFVDFPTRYLNHKLPKLGVFLDMNCNDSESMITVASRERIFTHHFHWLLYDQLANLQNLKRIFERTNLSINTEITYAALKDSTDYDNITTELSNYILYDVYNKGSYLGGKLNVTIDQEIACNNVQCQRVQYLSDLHKRSRINQRKSLHGLTIRVAAVITKIPFNSTEAQIIEYLGSEANTHEDTFARLGFHLRLVLRDMFDCNFSYTFTDLWSSTETSGGMIGELFAERAELASAPFLITVGRLPYFDALTDVCTFRSFCMFRTTHNTGFKPSAFLEPFEPPVWYVFTTVLIVSAALLWIIFFVEQSNIHGSLQYIPSPLATCLISFGTACIQGSYLTPRSNGGRIAFLALIFTSFLMYNYYTSLVVSSLLGMPARSNIRTIQQLADSSLDVAFHLQPYTRTFVKISPRADIRSLYKQKVENRKNNSSIWLPTEEGVLKVRDTPNFAYILDATSAYSLVRKHYLSHEICQLNEIQFRPEKYGQTVVNKNMSYKELVRLNEVRMLETGILHKHHNYWVSTKLHCVNSNHIVAVGFEYTTPLFIMLLFAYALTILILGMELAWKHRGGLKWRI